MKLLVVLAITLVSSSALAQDRKLVDDWVDRWSEQNEIHVTKSARGDVFSSLHRPAFSKAEEERIQQERAKVTTIETRPGVLDPYSGHRVNSFLERFPTIRIVVQPTPPRDYSVSINGEDCPATEKSLYKVPAGVIEVRVERPGKPPCVWSGPVFSGQKEVASDL
jgi:hypothetical protein